MQRSTFLPSSYSRPTNVTIGGPLHVRSDLPRPLQRPSLPSTLPSLPSRPRPKNLINGYSLSTHIFPAAYARTSPHVPAPELPLEAGCNAETKRVSLKVASDEILNTRLAYEGGRLEAQEGNSRQLWCCMNRYVRQPQLRESRGQGLTLFFAHGIGYSKEIWEPTLAHLVTSMNNGRADVQIDEIWCIDSVQHGDSALLNAENLSGLFDWADNSRDILQFLLHYMPDSHFAELPTHLPRLPDHVAQARQKVGFSNHTLIGVGHSFGGITLLQAAHKCPALFSSLLPLDPLFSPYLFDDADRTAALKPVIANTIRRRNFWKTREEAFLSFSSNPFFAVWNPSALHTYVLHALYDDPVTGGVRLKMNPVQEAIVYETRAYAEIWQLLPTLDERVDLYWIMAGIKAWFPRPDGIDQELVWRRPMNSRNIILDCGHGVPMERPKELANEIFTFLQRKFGFQTTTDAVRAHL